ncbi:3-hydroxyacyl-CoA dehydrogenase NAD-binding domain-containing protein [Enterovirga aerilata]|uniref:3-hydroxyacyl-CoA dehydrogenase n=1 Tax=Enterovirga aerilata TaxID=2730920 RepID=A0A849I724_9HYPH|nr:3-hydroxyacyl-CoA dehydrogenase NAD-binding domain-containing protein [Enterovirga sp. DB1703]NNM72209.1 3-hydroxyacyl-CoA dehydrogenase [Enterovirga sp. DB1703]
MIARAVERVAVVGTGVIGASWAAHFLARGLDVIATDPSPDAESRLRADVDAAWPALVELGLAPHASRSRLRFVPELESAVADVDFVQENGPEREDVKRELFRRIGEAAAPDVILASSSSGFGPSVFQDAARNPERVLVGHPFNPPHLVPLVEVVGGRATSDEALEAAMAFYAAVGKRPIRIRRELVGHVVNRIQAALWREAFHLVESGAVTVPEVDAAIAHGPGLRWALMGPCLLNHLSGGPGGLKHTLDHLGPLMERMWADLGTPRLTPELKAALVAGVGQELAAIDPAAMLAERDRLLVGLLSAKAKANNLP